MGIISGLLSMVLWGVAIYLAAIASRKLGNVLTLFWMQFFGFVIALIYFLYAGAGLDSGAIVANFSILVAIAVLQVIAYLAFYRGLEKADVSLVSPVGATWGLIVAILGVVFLGEVLTGLQVAAIALIAAGIVSISIDFKDLVKSRRLKLLVGVKEGVIAMLGWGGSLFLLSFPSNDLGWFLPTFIFRGMILMILVSYIGLSGKQLIPKEKFPWKLVAAIGLFDVGAFFSFSYGLSGANASIVGPIASAFSLVTVLLAWMFLKEKISKQKWMGILGIVVGLVLISI